MSKRVIMEFPDFKVSVSATLLEETNPELCQVFWNHLPFECVQEHGVISGEIVYCWVPIVTTAPVRAQEKLDETPVGRLLYSQMTGNKLIAKYGPVTEPLKLIPIGQVAEEDIEKLKTVGRAVWDSAFYTKELIRVHFTKEDGS